MGRIVYIVNPVSGRGVRGTGRKARVDAFIERHDIDAVSYETERAGHGTELAEEALRQGACRIVCVGGDGTLNEVATTVMESGVPLALIPMGSGNGLARHLGIPMQFEAALKASLADHILDIDVGVANGRPFFNVMGFGLDAVIGKRFNETKSRGFLTYLREGLRAVRTYRASEISIDSMGKQTTVFAYLLAIANSSQYGSNAVIAPDASVHDGKLNLVTISTPSIVGFFDLFQRMFRGEIYGSEYVRSFCGDRFLIHLSRPNFFHADGEIFDAEGTIEIETRPRALRVIVPTLNAAARSGRAIGEGLNYAPLGGQLNR